MRLDTIELPDDLFWSDETAPWAVGQSVTTTLTGALVIQEGARQAGRPITLESGRGSDDLFACVPRSTVDALLVLANTAGAAAMSLQIEGRAPIAVRFRHTDGVAVDAAPVIVISPFVESDWYHLTLRLMQV